ncbi:MAG: hypothetical protein IPG28_18705 [Betaproteobacteria bacterium]|nr:hypothetical protein [Betaproteobacteria bacterium]
MVNLQAVADAMAGDDAAGSDRQLNKRVVNFDFSGIVDRFRCGTGRGSAVDQLLGRQRAGGFPTFPAATPRPSAATRPDDYGHRNALTDIGISRTGAVVAATGFGVAAQSLQSFATLHAGTQRLC